MEKLLISTVKEENLSAAIEDWVVLSCEVFQPLKSGFEIAKRTFLDAVPNEAVLKCEEAINRILRNSSIYFDTVTEKETNNKVCRLTVWDESNNANIEYIASEFINKEEGQLPLTKRVLIDTLFKLYDSISSDIQLIEKLSGFNFTHEYHYIKDNLNDLIMDYFE